MNSKPVILAALVSLFAPAPFAASFAQTAQQQEPVVDRERGLAEWEKVNAAFSHPRCANCHVEDEHPRWSGPHYGGTRFHAFNVQRGDDGSGFGNAGLRCSTCHFETNSQVLHGPPGAENWHLAPAEMVWFGKTSA